MVERERRLEELHAAHYGAVRAYALRRTDPHAAQEVVAEVFVVAWRRLDDVPTDALPWLFGVARRVLANQRRGAARRDALHDRLAEQAAIETPSPPTRDPLDRLAGDAAHVHAALARLTDRDREALLLVAWEGLEPAVAARAYGCSRATFAVRLHRARRRLAAALAAELTPAPHSTGVEDAVEASR
jgi:RNA polymerase sigma-70 factor (ECF subfamily)